MDDSRAAITLSVAAFQSDYTVHNSLDRTPFPSLSAQIYELTALAGLSAVLIDRDQCFGVPRIERDFAQEQVSPRSWIGVPETRPEHDGSANLLGLAIGELRRAILHHLLEPARRNSLYRN